MIHSVNTKGPLTYSRRKQNSQGHDSQIKGTQADGNKDAISGAKE